MVRQGSLSDYVVMKTFYSRNFSDGICEEVLADLRKFILHIVAVMYESIIDAQGVIFRIAKGLEVDFNCVQKMILLTVMRHDDPNHFGWFQRRQHRFSGKTISH